MTFKIDLLTVVACLGTFQGLVFTVVFWLKNKNISNKIFALFLLATSIRIAKNIFVHLSDLNPDLFQSRLVWRTSVYAGISHQFAIGPFLYFYFLSKLQDRFVWKKTFYIHLVPYFILIIMSPFLTWSFWKFGGLWLSYLSILVYFLLSLYSFVKHKAFVDKGTAKWLGGLLVVIFILLFAYSPALFRYVGYVGGAMLYSIAILISGYFMLINKGSVSFFRTKYETSSLKPERVGEIRELIEASMNKNRSYLNPELSMIGLAKEISVSSHHLSRVINQEFESSFTDYINSFRIEEAKKRLLDSSYDHLKLSAMVFECGFNSVPTFNTLFKKKYKMTPSEFRQRQRKSSRSSR
ncbi:MAG: helix-turn-helix domain-containing protein [Cyclobacteriaceae bacterium]